MRFRDLNVDFGTIDELYEFLEKNSHQFDYGWDIVKAISNLRTSIIDGETRNQLAWETACFSFEFRGSELFALGYSYDPNAEEVQKYPASHDFEEAGFTYIKARAKQTENFLLRSRYNHLLWKGPRGVKDRSYAIEAIKGYTALIDQLLDIKEGKEDEKFLQVSNHYESLASLCTEVNYVEKEAINAITKRLLFISKVPFFLRHAVLDTMLKNSKYFKAGDFRSCLSLFEEELVSSEKPDHHFMVNYYLPTALKIAQKVSEDVRKWHNHIGDCYMKLASAEDQEDRYWIKLDYYARAIHAFGYGADENKKTLAEQLYFELKPKVRLDTVRLHFSSEQIDELKEMYSGMEANAKSMLEGSPESVYAIIMFGKGIFPSAKKLKEQEKDNENDFLNTVSRIDFDKNKNIAGKQSNEGKSFLDPYHMEIQGITSPFLEYLFVGGVTSDKLNYENFLIFLKKHTWIGKPYTRFDLGGDEYVTDWIKLLAPSIIEYFVQTAGSAQSKFFKADYTLCIDSLVLKLEGLLRNFCEQANLATNVSSRVGIQEANINQILEIEGLKNYFNEDDFLLFKYLLINDEGLNIRNNVAHCFYSQSDYTRNKIHLLLAALLRIGKFGFKEKVTT
jgi:hypothetical protein